MRTSLLAGQWLVMVIMQRVIILGALAAQQYINSRQQVCVATVATCANRFSMLVQSCALHQVCTDVCVLPVTPRCPHGCNMLLYIVYTALYTLQMIHPLKLAECNIIHSCS